MPLTTANINWNGVQGSTGYLIEYKQPSDVTWTKPTSPANPTLNLTYPLTLNTNTTYYVRITNYGSMCAPLSRVITIVTPAGVCCPAGYTFSPDNTYCYQTQTTPAIPPTGGTPATTTAQPNVAFGTCGSYIYRPGYNLNGTGTSDQIPLSNAFWVNGAGFCANNDTVSGPVNRTALWAGSPQPNQSAGFGVCVNLPASATYYIGMAADNSAQLKVDSVTIVNQDPAALGTQYAGNSAILDRTFKIWHIYPVNLSAGPHILEIIGTNDADNTAMIGCEIYNASSTDLINATSYAALGSKLIFSSKDYIGKPSQIGSGGAGYTCPTGYALSTCSSPIICQKIVTSSPFQC